MVDKIVLKTYDSVSLHFASFPQISSKTRLQGSLKSGLNLMSGTTDKDGRKCIAYENNLMVIYLIL